MCVYVYETDIATNLGNWASQSSLIMMRVQGACTQKGRKSIKRLLQQQQQHLFGTNSI